MNFLDAIAEPLADLLRAVADWLDGEFEDVPDSPIAESPKPLWKPNSRGGFDPVEANQSEVMGSAGVDLSSDRLG